MMTRRGFLGRLWTFGRLALCLLVLGRAPRAFAGDDFAGTAYVGKTRAGRFKRFYINYWKPMRRIDGASWRLDVGGLCERPLTLSLNDILALPVTWRSSRLKCVECWSARARWGGFRFREIESLAGPLPEAQAVRFTCGDGYSESLAGPLSEAQAVRFTCGDGYSESLPLASLHQEGVLLAHAMDGEPLSDEHGFPLRLIAPSKYGYKNPKAIVRIDFIDRAEPGTWSRIGAYSWDGTILPGTDHPLEFDKSPRRIPGGEIVDY